MTGNVRFWTCAAAILSMFALPAAGSRQQSTFRASVEVVRVDVLVTEQGRPVPGLKASDFELLDNDVPQIIEAATTAGDVTAALVLDTSGSLSDGRLDMLVEASRQLVDRLRHEDAMSLVRFALRMNAVGPVRDPASVRAALMENRAGGRTAIWDALFAGISLVATGGPTRSLVILFTDGLENSSWLTLDGVVECLKRANVVVYVVKAGGRNYSPPLEQIAAASGGSVFVTDWEGGLTRQFARVLDEFRSRYVLTYQASGVRLDDGWHRLAVRLKGRSGLVRARPGYYAGAPGSKPK